MPDQRTVRQFLAALAGHHHLAFGDQRRREIEHDRLVACPRDADAKWCGRNAPLDPAAPGLFHLSEDGALTRVLGRAGFGDVRQDRVQLSLFARDPAEFWGMLTDMAGPLAPLRLTDTLRRYELEQAAA